MKKNILILVYESELFNSIAAAKILQNKYNIIFFCCDWFTALSNENVEKIKKSGVNYEKIFDIKDEVYRFNLQSDSKKIYIDYNYISKFENLYLKERITHLGFKDFAINNTDSPRDHYYHPNEKTLIYKYYEYILKKIEEVIKFKKYYFIYSVGTSNLIRNIFISFGRKKKIPFYTSRSRFGLIYLSDCSIEKSNVKYFLKKKNIKRDFLYYKNSNKIYNNNKIYNISNVFESFFDLFSRFIGQFIDNFKNRVSFKRPNYYQEKNRFLIIFQGIKDIYNKFKIQKLLLRNINKKISIIKKDKFLYFPLHIIPEGGVFDQNDYIDEYYLIYKISKLIPADFKILVKPHPEIFSIKESIHSIYWYQKINKLKNVELISHNINNDLLLKNCITTISISGSASLECAIFYNKTSFVFGDIELIGVKNLHKFTNRIFLKFINKINKKNPAKNYHYNINLLKKIKYCNIYNNYKNKNYISTISTGLDFYNLFLTPDKKI